MTNDDLIEVKEFLSESFGTKKDDLNLEILDDFNIEQGMMGEIFPILVTNNKTSEYVILKQQKTENGEVLEYCNNHFKNEMHFYENIWKRFSEIYEDRTGKILNLVPHCLGTSKSRKNGMWRIALENVTMKGFNTLDRKASYDDEHLRLLFRSFGNFHGLSMILKHQNEIEYRDLIEPLLPTFQFLFKSNAVFTKTLKGVARVVKDFFDPKSEGDLIKKIISFEKNGPEMCDRILNSNKYEGVLLHCDCWSNNYMFKYNENNQVENVNFIDFQHITCNSPAVDLSYCLYSGGTVESFKKLNEYLLIYHNSLSDTLREFDIDAEEIYSFERLTEEWKKYCTFGFAMAMNLWRIKFIDEAVTVEIEPEMEEKEFLEPVKIKEDREEEYKQKMRDLVYHMYENEFF